MVALLCSPILSHIITMFLPIGIALIAQQMGASATLTLAESQSDCDTYTVTGISGGFQQRTQADFSGVISGDDAAATLSCVFSAIYILSGIASDNGRPTQPLEHTGFLSATTL